MPPFLTLHHYKESPYAEKIRALMGYKGLAWQSVTVPRIAPKPDLVALTGGYRKVPVLQVGADVYCDTRLIAQVIDAWHPSPALATASGHLGPLLENWVDQVLFGQTVAFTFGRLADVLPDALLADRAALRGAPLDRQALKQAMPLVAQALAQPFDWLAQALDDGRDFFNGHQPDVGDFALYATVWFARVGQLDLAAWPSVARWFDRMAGFGHGHITAIDASTALAQAQAATPAPLPEVNQLDASGLVPGQRVAVTPESLGHGTSVTGELLQVSPQRLTLRHNHELCGTVHVHFPRLGYRAQAV